MCVPRAGPWEGPAALACGEGIALDGLWVERNARVVLKQIHLKIEPRDWLVLCGPSGAGKSTLLRLIAGLDAPARGCMRRLGRKITCATRPSQRLDGDVALLAQNPEHHFIASTVRQDIAWGLLRRGQSASEAAPQVAAIAGELGVFHLLDRPHHELSFGEQRRVALAGLLVLKPRVLLLDEPTAGLDPVAARELVTLVQEMTMQRDLICIWATHDLHALPPARRLLLMREGELVFDGPKSEGLTQAWLERAGLFVSDGL